MARNRFAQPLYGKIIYIYETDLTMEQLSIIFDPATYWIDVTGQDCEVGYIQAYEEGVGIVWVAPPNQAPLTLEEAKDNKIALMKAERDAREVAVIEYKDITLDYDDKARERLRIAREAIEDNNLPGILWTCADNSRAVLTLEDFKGINSLAAERSTLLHDQYNLLKDYIDVIETQEELDSVYFDMEVPEIEEKDDFLVDDSADSTEIPSEFAEVQESVGDGN